MTQYVNGFAYNTMRPAPDEEIPQRFARAEEVWEQKVWREQLEEWDDDFKPPRSRPTASCRRSTPTRSPTTSWSPT